MFPRGVRHCLSTQPSMHRIFEIDEILCSITEFVGDSSPASAVSFACCCKAFEEHALTPIWRDIHVTQLLQILHEDIRGSWDPNSPSYIVRILV